MAIIDGNVLDMFKQGGAGTSLVQIKQATGYQKWIVLHNVNNKSESCSGSVGSFIPIISVFITIFDWVEKKLLT